MITVICSVYNSAEYLLDHLICLERQLLDRFNIVFVDANSTDNSLQILKNFHFREGIDVTIIETPYRIKLYDAWNVAIKNASTKYIVNLNTDDRLFPCGLSIYNEYAKKYPDITLFYGDKLLVVSNIEHDKILGINNWGHFSHNSLLRTCPCGPFPMVKKASLKNVGPFDSKYSICGDYDMWLRLSSNGYRFLDIPEIVGTYFQNPVGISTDKSHLPEAYKQIASIQHHYNNYK